ncbi:MAG: hypothetical protein WCC36_13605 [Gammaproteobacteria bacterium]
MNDDKKKIVSLRLGVGDRRKVKTVADRLGVAESDVFRFAIKRVLDRLAPLHSEGATAEDLIRVFLEFGPELTDYFKVDAQRLEQVLSGHDGVAERMEPRDIELLAMGGTIGSSGRARLDEALSGREPELDNGATMREYFYAKYIRSSENHPLDG